jgi:DUF4097 and DUF4098 domain-containing protein YvlB
MQAPEAAVPPRLTITGRSGSIVVRAGSGPGVEAHGAKVRLDPDGSTRIDGGSGKIEVTCPAGSDVILGTASGKVSLEGPLGDVRVTGSSGRVHIADARSIDLRVRSGSVDIERCHGTCHVVAVSSRIEIANAGEIDVTGVSGTIAMKSVAGGHVRTTSGRISVGLDRAADLDVHAVSGKIEIDVPPGVAPEMRLHTISGKVRKDVDKGCDCNITVKTVSGSITIRRT